MNSWARVATHPFAVSALAAFAVTGGLYGDVLGLPLFSDDLIQLPWQESTSWSALWSSPSPYGYYRPLTYTLWRFWGYGTGGLRPFGLHLLNLAAHFAVAWLAGLLAAAWVDTPPDRWSRAVPVFLTAASVAAFPFSRQAVAWPSAVSYPIVTGLALAALLAYDLGRRQRGAMWSSLSLLLTLLAPFAHESGILVGPLILVAESVGHLHDRWSSVSRWPLAFVCSSVLGFVGWRILLDRSVIAFGLNVPNLLPNLGYLLQGLVYPVAPLAQRLAEILRMDPLVALWVVALPTLGLLTWYGLRRNRPALVLGLSWFGLFVTPPLVTMEADWFAQAPRFLYVAAVGVSLVWASGLSTWIRFSHRWMRVVVVGLLSAGLLVPGVVFVRTGIRLYEMAGESIWGAVRESAQTQPLLLINLPSRLIPQRRQYPVGFEGIAPLPDRVDAEALVYAHTGIRDAATSLAFGAVAGPKTPNGYAYELFGQPANWDDVASGIRAARSVYLTRYDRDSISLSEAGSILAPAPRAVAVARFADRVSLLDAVATCDRSGTVKVITTWRLEQDVDADATVFSHLLGADGAIVAQADGYPLLGMFPFWLWRPGETGRDLRYFEGILPGGYALKMGLWEWMTGDRWPTAENAEGTVLLSVHCP